MSSKLHRVQRYLDEGNFAAAEVVLDGVLRAAPGDPAAHWYLASVHQCQGRMRRAVRHAREALGLVAGRPASQALCVSRVLLSTGQYEDAYRLLMRLSPFEVEPDGRREAAEQLLTMDRPREALAWLDGLPPHAARGLELTRADVLRVSGDVDAARDAYMRAADLEPLDPHPLFGLSCMDTDDDPAARIDRLRRVHREAEAAGWGMAYPWEVLHYAAFAELDRLGEHGEAWSALDAGLRSRRRRIRHDDAQDEAMFDALADVLDAWQPASADASGAPRPLFVVGLPRSGLTLVERWLSAHPDIHACGELNDLRMAYKFELDEYTPAVLDARGAERMIEIDPRRVGELYRSRTAWRTGGARYFVDRLPGNALLLPLVLAGMPDARVIHVRRDAMDGGFGTLRTLFAPTYYAYSYRQDEAGAHVRRFRRFMSLVEAWAGDRVISVDYETLARAPDATIRALHARLGLPVSAHAEEGHPRAGGNSRGAPWHAGTHGIGAWRAYADHLGDLQRAVAGVGR